MIMSRPDPSVAVRALKSAAPYIRMYKNKVFVIKAGEIHSFKALGDSPLVQVDVHLSPRFIQENL